MPDTAVRLCHAIEQVQLYSSVTNKLKRTISRFTAVAYGSISHAYWLFLIV
jgi:hypothetical protein